VHSFGASEATITFMYGLSMNNRFASQMNRDSSFGFARHASILLRVRVHPRNIAATRSHRDIVIVRKFSRSSSVHAKKSQVRSRVIAA
jgi:hypothetical protein